MVCLRETNQKALARITINNSGNVLHAQEHLAKLHQDTDEQEATEDFHIFYDGLTGNSSNAGSAKKNSRWLNGVGQKVNKNTQSSLWRQVFSRRCSASRGTGSNDFFTFVHWKF